MQVLIDVKGHGRVPDADVPDLKAKFEALQAAAAAVGIVLRADFVVSHPEEETTPDVPPPSPAEEIEQEQADTTGALQPSDDTKPEEEERV